MMEELSIEVVFNQSIGQKSPNCQRENFDLNAAYKGRLIIKSVKQ
jgi:hypothetical protein